MHSRIITKWPNVTWKQLFFSGESSSHCTVAQKRLLGPGHWATLPREWAGAWWDKQKTSTGAERHAAGTIPRSRPPELTPSQCLRRALMRKSSVLFITHNNKLLSLQISKTLQNKLDLEIWTGASWREKQSHWDDMIRAIPTCVSAEISSW